MCAVFFLLSALIFSGYSHDVRCKAAALTSCRPLASSIKTLRYSKQLGLVPCIKYIQNDFIWWNDAAIKPRRFEVEHLLWASRSSCQALEMDTLYSHIVKKYMHLSSFKAASDGIWGGNRGSTGQPEFCWQLNKIFIVCDVEEARSEKMMHCILHKETLNEDTVKKKKKKKNI